MRVRSKTGGREAISTPLKLAGFAGNYHGYSDGYAVTRLDGDGLAHTTIYAYLPRETVRVSERYFVCRIDHPPVYPRGRYPADYWHYQAISLLYGSKLQMLTNPVRRGARLHWRLINHAAMVQCVSIAMFQRAAKQTVPMVTAVCKKVLSLLP